MPLIPDVIGFSPLLFILETLLYIFKATSCSSSLFKMHVHNFYKIHGYISGYLLNDQERDLNISNLKRHRIFSLLTFSILGFKKQKMGFPKNLQIFSELLSQFTDITSFIIYSGKFSDSTLNFYLNWVLYRFENTRPFSIYRPFDVKATGTTLISVECIAFHQRNLLDDVHKV